MREGPSVPRIAMALVEEWVHLGKKYERGFKEGAFALVSVSIENTAQKMVLLFKPITNAWMLSSLLKFVKVGTLIFPREERRIFLF